MFQYNNEIPPVPPGILILNFNLFTPVFVLYEKDRTVCFARGRVAMVVTAEMAGLTFIQLDVN